MKIKSFLKEKVLTTPMGETYFDIKTAKFIISEFPTLPPTPKTTIEQRIWFSVLGIEVIRNSYERKFGKKMDAQEVKLLNRGKSNSGLSPGAFLSAFVEGEDVYTDGNMLVVGDYSVGQLGTLTWSNVIPKLQKAYKEYLKRKKTYPK